MTSPDRRAAAEKVRLGYAAYTPPAVGSAPTLAQGSVAGPQPQKQRRSRGQGPVVADALRMNGVGTDHRSADKVRSMTALRTIRVRGLAWRLVTQAWTGWESMRCSLVRDCPWIVGQVLAKCQQAVHT